MSVKITYFVHGTTTDNEKNLCTGWAPGQLSDLGKNQARELGELVKDKNFGLIFCSDLQRAVDSAQFAFGDKYKIVQDKRLRECNYGDFNQADENKVDYKKQIEMAFPNGESMKDVENRIKDFVDFLKNNYNGQHIAIMAHKAPQLALEVILNNKTWGQAIDTDWRKTKAWQAGWEYIIK